MGIIRLRPRRAALTQTLPLRPLQPSTHNTNGVRTSRTQRSRHGFGECGVRYRENSYDSASESSGDESCCEDKSTQCMNNTLLDDPRIRIATQHLLQVVRAQLDEILSQELYTEPQHHEQTQQARRDECDWVIPTTYPLRCYREFRGRNDSFVVIPPGGGHSHYQCPFYASNPKKYPACLIDHELLSIESVKRHVERHHAKPPYCPRCAKTFDSVSKCDRHILEKRCRTESLKIPDGINLYQRSRLSTKDNPKLSDKRRWERIYKTIFPGVESCPSPYLDSGVGLAVSMARDFWRIQGTEIISEFLAGQNWLPFGQGDAHTVLYELVKFDLITQLMEEP
ncbi:hypothetical protein FANTH_13280 [Fusarium anthophilum]|uniref:C2H2-type domain-containing protein n=1 Tax=Fusarium anthophilum TaxID=48485 RepID=A0A8H4YPK7_9HYPO|nr:hypothetical protein FANTH_13280 [Fusarium anthophilum]